MLVHTGEKHYKCHLCNYLSSPCYKLKSHILTHSKNKPFNCDVCEDGTVRKQNLQKHMFRHSKTKLRKIKLTTAKKLKINTHIHIVVTQWKNHISANIANIDVVLNVV